MPSVDFAANSAASARLDGVVDRIHIECLAQLAGIVESLVPFAQTFLFNSVNGEPGGEGHQVQLVVLRIDQPTRPTNSPYVNDDLMKAHV